MNFNLKFYLQPTPEVLQKVDRFCALSGIFGPLPLWLANYPTAAIVFHVVAGLAHIYVNSFSALQKK
jgi:hypothetical protein